MTSAADPGDPPRWPSPAAAAAFEGLGDAEKVQFSQSELGAASALLEELLRRHDALRTVVADPNGLVRFTLGNDGRLVELFVDDAVGQQLDNLGFEALFNSLLESGNRAVQTSLDDLRDHGLDDLGG